ncbi:MAG: hypothetical protein IPL65_10490 [Lewinellaceae bacterium]|nr:hypothetical protein [Lewinellaceae bacterium]
MFKSDLVETISLFNEAERARLLDFLRSPYCNPNYENQEPIRLLELIFQILDARRPAELQKETLYTLVFPGQNPVRNKLEKLFSSTLKIVRQFLTSEYQQKNKHANWALLAEIEFFREKGEYPICERLYGKLRDWQKQDTPWDYDDYLFNWEIERHKQILRNEIYQKKDDQNILSALSALETLYLSQRHFYTFYLHTLQQITPILDEAELKQLRASVAMPNNTIYLHSAESKLFRAAIDMMQNNGAAPDIVFHFLEELEAHWNALNDMAKTTSKPLP